ncbi:ABC transporter permease [Limosilactobacillus agrestis]|uniref:ABC transporter permease n=1 Tax=Limosilactobacillus agrestis TaxID=2759748 RepID=A0A7W3UIU1_9LACO|nr:ABC transporter permease [Limosilactobacillus agrestis]MBB1095785.1 ABC transporter permease [Limosilactobacillus agrestis]MCD7130939.1 ABC transporter permease [Limosilactobacillus agrestis]
MKKQRWSWGKTYLALVFVILYAPILYLVVFSFSGGQTMEKYHGFSWQHYADLFADTRMITIVINTLLVAFLASLLATIIGTLGALAIKDARRPWKNSLLSLNNVLMVSPDVIIGASFLIFFTMLGVRLGFVSVLLSHIAFCIPIVVLMVLPKLNEMSPTLVDAAYDLGASRWQVLSRVILPSIAPGIFAGYFMAFTYSLDDFAVTFFVTGNGFSTLSVEIYSRARQGINLEINALSTLMFIVSLLLVIGYYFISKRGGRRTRIVAVKEGDAQ